MHRFAESSAIFLLMSTQPAVGPISPAWTWGDKVRKARRLAGLSQKAFAEQIGIKSPTLAAWEASDSIEPPKGAVSAAKRIELAFNVSAAWMLDLELHVPGPGDGPDGGVTPEGEPTRGYARFSALAAAA